jgi:hypothetical protein
VSLSPSRPATIPTDLQALLKNAGRGMQNCGNSCYMASALTSLVHVPSIAQKVWNTHALPPGMPVSWIKTRKCMEYFFQNGWKAEGTTIGSERDPQQFMEYLYPHLNITPIELQSQRVGQQAKRIQLSSIVLLSRLLKEPTTVQNMLTESAERPKIAFYEDAVPDFLPIILATRTSDSKEKNTTELVASLSLQIPLVEQQSKKAIFDLVSVIVYLGDRNTNGHYISFVRENGTWVKYDDDQVTVYPDTSKIQELLHSHSYVFCYSKRNNAQTT